MTEVKESLASQLANKESECQGLNSQLTKVQTELDVLKKKEQEEELQVAFFIREMKEWVSNFYIDHQAFILPIINKMSVRMYICTLIIVSFEDISKANTYSSVQHFTHFIDGGIEDGDASRDHQ